jgi:hypothetical protein
MWCHRKRQRYQRGWLLFATSGKRNDSCTPDEDEEAGRVDPVKQTVPSSTTVDDNIANDGLCVGSTVIAKTTIPSLGI